MNKLEIKYQRSRKSVGAAVRISPALERSFRRVTMGDHGDDPWFCAAVFGISVCRVDSGDISLDNGLDIVGGQ